MSETPTYGTGQDKQKPHQARSLRRLTNQELLHQVCGQWWHVTGHLPSTSAAGALGALGPEPADPLCGMRSVALAGPEMIAGDRPEPTALHKFADRRARMREETMDSLELSLLPPLLCTLVNAGDTCSCRVSWCRKRSSAGQHLEQENTCMASNAAGMKLGNGRRSQTELLQHDSIFTTTGGSHPDTAEKKLCYSPYLWPRCRLCCCEAGSPPGHTAAKVRKEMHKSHRTVMNSDVACFFLRLVPSPGRGSPTYRLGW